MHAGIVSTEEELAEIARSAQTVAVVGDGRDPGAPAFTVPRLLKSHGLRVIPVNPEIRESLGETSRPDLAAVGEAIDVVDVFRRSENIPAHAEEVLRLPAHLRPKVFWMQSGIRNQSAAEKLVAAGVRVVMDECLGVLVDRFRGRD